MKVDVKIVPSRDGTGLLSSNAAYELQLTIDFSDAEKAALERKMLRESLHLRRMDINSDLQSFRWADCIIEDPDSTKHDTLVSAQGALVDFMAAVADVFMREEASNSDLPRRPEACN